MEELLILIEKFGVTVGLLCVFLYWAYQKDKRQEMRYDAIGKKLDDVRDEQQKELVDLSNRAIEAQQHGTAVQQEFIAEFRQRPCLRNEHV